MFILLLLRWDSNLLAGHLRVLGRGQREVGVKAATSSQQPGAQRGGRIQIVAWKSIEGPWIWKIRYGQGQKENGSQRDERNQNVKRRHENTTTVIARTEVFACPRLPKSKESLIREKKYPKTWVI